VSVRDRTKQRGDGRAEDNCPASNTVKMKDVVSILPGRPMQEQRERWMQLCEQAATEQDPEKLMALITEINRLLEAKERRLRQNSPAPKPTE